VGHRPELRDVVTVPTGGTPLPASDVDGRDLTGRRCTLRLTSPGEWTLLLFLSAHCDGCAPFWTVPRAPTSCGLEPGDVAVVVTRDPADEDEETLATLSGEGDPVSESTEPVVSLVMSSSAWRTYRVHGPPFFVLVDGASVATEGVAWSLEQVAADVARARRRGTGEAQGHPRVRR
jgi:hypothetical protein